MGHAATQLSSSAIVHGTATADDSRAAAALYLRAFPHIAAQWFTRESKALAFYDDLLELMRVAHGPSFFTAYSAQQLAGFLVLTTPGVSLFQCALHDAVGRRIARHALMGAYGFSTKVLARAWTRMRGTPLDRMETLFAGEPHVYIVAVDARFADQGIGTELLARARDYCTSRFSRLWLTVETDNTSAIRFYQRAGFRTVNAGSTMQCMSLDLQS